MFTSEEFAEQYEKRCRICIITHTTESWEVEKYWTFQKLYELYEETSFKVGEDNKGKKLKLPMKYFLEYLVYNRDDSPLYLFERYRIPFLLSSPSSLEDLKDAGKKILKRYKQHPYFQDDFFSLVGEKHRPPYRWFLVG